MLGISCHHVGRSSKCQFCHVGCRSSTRDLLNSTRKLRIRRCLDLRGCEQGTNGKRKWLEEILARHKGP